MTQVYEGPKKRIRDEIEKIERALLHGIFKDFTEARVLVGRRQSLLTALDIFNEQVDLENDDADS